MYNQAHGHVSCIMGMYHASWACIMHSKSWQPTNEQNRNRTWFEMVWLRKTSGSHWISASSESSEKHSSSRSTSSRSSWQRLTNIGGEKKRGLQRSSLNRENHRHEQVHCWWLFKHNQPQTSANKHDKAWIPSATAKSSRAAANFCPWAIGRVARGQWRTKWTKIRKITSVIPASVIRRPGSSSPKNSSRSVVLSYTLNTAIIETKFLRLLGK